jgi:secondary thiamine-phosphate synthase enzyme
MTQEFFINTKKREELIDISDEVSKKLNAFNLKDGACLIYVPHTTACVCINENADPSVKTDIVKTLNRIIPHTADYEHGEGNSDAHIKSSLIGSSRIVLVQEKRLVLGTWQGIYLCEFDGPRKRKVIVMAIPA